MSDGGELVYVVPRERILGPRGWHGVVRTGGRALLEVIASVGRFEPRAAMEADPRFKQVIPYLVLRDRGRCFLMRRTRAGGDARLHDRFSIGVGGHLNPGDVDLRGRAPARMGRGARGGLRAASSGSSACSTTTRPPWAGSTWASSTSREAAGRPVAVRETDKLEGRFVPPREVLAVYDRMETWSQLVCDFVRRRAAGGHGGPRVTDPAPPGEA